MDWYEVLALLLGMLLAFMALGLPVVFAFFAANLVGAWIFMGGEIGVMQLVRNAAESVQSFALLPIPLFILMGEVMFHTGVAGRAIDAVDKLIARVPGRLSLVAIAGGTVFSSLSGSTIANTAMLSATLLPEMTRRGYHPSIAVGPIIAVGGLAMLIPPSALAVLLGSVARIPIGELLIASIVPAFILAGVFFAYIVLRCRLDPSLAPAYEVARLSWRERLMPAVKYVLPLMSIFVVVVGSIIGGVATPTESAALGAAASVAAAAAYGRLTGAAFRVALRETLRLTVMTLFIICGSITFSQILAFTQASTGLSELVTGAGLSPMWVLLGMLGILLVLGCFMDQVSMMMITAPLFMPVAETLGLDAVWFGVLMLMVLEISLATPPFGLLLFVAKGAAPQIPMAAIIRSVAPFIAIALGVVGLLAAFPQLTLWLPRLMAP
ncbi:MAG: TRAP transporter large permease [Betaproteobacteria bacterium]|nr:TRAP transporter large permease [Betaproteobacteria bacterium]MDH5220830.1 TRAP transporter large permease [Betaproteobacteria bacterium]MDH5349840.1 TRAP transporter large permease [Betaproteobacteria bacterium]